MTLKIITKEGKVFLEYIPRDGADFITEKIDDDGISIRKTFYFDSQSSFKINENHSTATFLIGEISGDYYRIFKDCLRIQFDVLFYKNYELKITDFITDKDTSILSKLESLAYQQIIIGGSEENGIPEDIYKALVKAFPTKTELMHYKNARITDILSEYLEGVKDSRNAFDRYLERKDKMRPTGNMQSLSAINEYEIEKYSFIRDTLNKMLQNSEVEKEWEKKILEIILILFPKYIKAYHSVPVNDYYTEPGKTKKREIDLALLDANYHLDVIEIKRPSYYDTVSEKPYSTRDNHIPMKNLSSAVMQIEKYIFHLNKWGKEGEKELSNKYGHEIQIVNPKGILIMGRCNTLTTRQKLDFEIIKRQYSNIVDVITYDDLLRRLDRIIETFTQKNDSQIKRKGSKQKNTRGEYFLNTESSVENIPF